MGAIKFIIQESKKYININYGDNFYKIKKRGPNETVIFTEETPSLTSRGVNANLVLSRKEIEEYKQLKMTYGYHRLSINDNSANGSQPFQDPIQHQLMKYTDLRNRPIRRLLCNGEIYNWKELKDANEFGEKDLQSECDVEIIMPMYIKYGLEDTLKQINGEYAFVLTENTNTFDYKNMNIYVVRDCIGLKPMYMVKGINKIFYMFVSELKSIPTDILLKKDEYTVMEIPIGHYWSFKKAVIEKSEEFVCYYDWDKHGIENCVFNTTDPRTLESCYESIREKIKNAVSLRIPENVNNMGILLSGGFNSSIILYSVLEELKNRNWEYKRKLDVFTIGYEGSKDVKYAMETVKTMKDLFGDVIKHHILKMEAISENDIEEIIWEIETYDKKTIINSIPIKMLYIYIKKYTINVKIIFTGDGLDEICGYSKIINTQTDDEFHNQSIKMVKEMNKFCYLRTDKITSGFGLEVRQPYTDMELIEYFYSLHPVLKKPAKYNIRKKQIEKYIIRQSYKEILNDMKSLWREKEEVTESLLPDISQEKCLEIQRKYYPNTCHIFCCWDEL